MRDISEVLDLFHEEGIVHEDDKPIPYLGWWWREIEHAVISYYQRKLWVNAARKWGYPSSSVKSNQRLKKDTLDFLKRHLKKKKHPHNDEFQKLLFEHCDKEFTSFSRDSFYKAEWDEDSSSVELTSVDRSEII